MRQTNRHTPMPSILRRLLSFLRLTIVEDGGGAVAEAPPAEAAAPAAESKPASMLDAINAHFEKSDAPADTQTAAERARDDQGRFVGKPQDKSTDPVEKPAEKPKAEVKAEPKEDDPLAMPEGLQGKAQERFQKLANENKQLQAAVQVREQAIGYVRDIFQQHRIQPQQFEQAASVIGMLNTGNLRGALQVLDEQRRQIALALGEPLPGVDALMGHPDLRSAVDQQQIDERHAIELARSRMVQASQQQRAQTMQQQAAQQQAEQAQVQQATSAVDELCKQLAASDLDYPAIEAQLLPVIPKLVQGLPPARWLDAVRTQYDLIKQVAGKVRQSPTTSGQVLRPTGQSSPAERPKSMYDAMWGGR